MAALGYAGIGMNKQFCFCNLIVDKIIYQLYLFMYMGEIEIIRQRHVAIYMKLCSIFLCTKIMYIYPCISFPFIQHLYNFRHHTKICLIH